MRMIDADKLITRLMDAELDQMQSKTGEELCQIVESMATVEQTEDAISRQAVLDGLASIAKAKAKSDAQKSLMGRVMFFTERLPSVNQQEPKWIPCSERLPEEYGEYLITWTTSQSKRPFIGISEGEVTSEYDHEHNRFKFEWLLEDYVKNYPDVKVLAWMPLPKPYDPQESEVSDADSN